MKNIKDNSNIKLKVLATATTLSFLLTGFKIVSSQKKLNKTLSKQHELFDEYTPVKLNNEITNTSYKYKNKTIPLKTINNNEELSLIFENQDEIISFYSKVFQLNEQIVKDKILELQNNNPYSWQYGDMLNKISYETEEQAIARTIADISAHPEDFDLVEEEIRKDNYELEEYLPEELICKFSDVIGINPNIALAIAYGECGSSLDSYNFTHNHNAAGIHPRDGYTGPTTSEGYVIYLNEAEGLFRFVLLLHDDFYVDIDSDIDRINSMSYTFCSVPDHWRNLVGGIYYDLEENGTDYYYTTFNYQGRDLVYPETPQKTYVIEK
ncbi:MAG: hypothetical protein IJ097_00080 [Bacilli bacterium]|nr:hypothetical protein [Bacilli bacterium]